MPLSVHFHAGDPHLLYSMPLQSNAIRLDQGLAIATDGVALVCQRVAMKIEASTEERRSFNWADQVDGSTDQALGHLSAEFPQPLLLRASDVGKLAPRARTEDESGEFVDMHMPAYALTLTPEAPVLTEFASGEEIVSSYLDEKDARPTAMHNWTRAVPVANSGMRAVSFNVERLRALADSLTTGDFVTLHISEDDSQPVVVTSANNQEAFGLLMPAGGGEMALTENLAYAEALARKAGDNARLEQRGELA